MDLNVISWEDAQKNPIKTWEEVEGEVLKLLEITGEGRKRARIGIARRYLAGAANNQLDGVFRRLQLDAAGLIGANWVYYSPWDSGDKSEVEPYLLRARAIVLDDAIKARDEKDEEERREREKEQWLARADAHDRRADSPPSEEKLINREKKFRSALKKGAIAMEPGISNLLWESSRDESVTVEFKTGRLDYHALWVFFVLADKVLRAKPGAVFKDAPELEKAGAELAVMEREEVLKIVPSIEFSDEDFRRVLGKPNISSGRIEEIVERLGCIVLKVTKFKGLYRIDPKTGKGSWTEYTSLVSSLAAVRTDKRERRKRGLGAKNNEERIYKVYFISPVGFAFLENLALRTATLIPRKFFELSGSAQELYLAICRSPKDAIFTPSGLARLLGWPEPENFALRYRNKKKAERYFNELQSADFISDWWFKSGAYYVQKKTDQRKIAG
jgi:hypothetical protein